MTVLQLSEGDGASLTLNAFNVLLEQVHDLAAARAHGLDCKRVNLFNQFNGHPDGHKGVCGGFGFVFHVYHQGMSSAISSKPLGAAGRAAGARVGAGACCCASLCPAISSKSPTRAASFIPSVPSCFRNVWMLTSSRYATTCWPLSKYGASDSARLPHSAASTHCVGRLPSAPRLPYVNASDKFATASPLGVWRNSTSRPIRANPFAFISQVPFSL